MLSIEQLREVLSSLAQADEVIKKAKGAKTPVEERLASLVSMARREVRLQLSESVDPWGDKENGEDKD